MAINNFETIDKYLDFQPGTFYKFECLIRNTDGANTLYEEGMSKTNKNILVKSWYVDNSEYYEKIKKEMINMANLTGARIYVTLDRKSVLKLLTNLANEITQAMVNLVEGRQLGIKSLSKMFASNTSKVESSDKQGRTLMWDVDTKNEDVLSAVIEYIEDNGQIPYTLETKKGYHVFCLRKFNHADWFEKCVWNAGSHFCEYTEEEHKQEVEKWKPIIKEYVSVKANELGLVYHPMKN